MPLGITRGPDGDLWFAESGVDQIGRVTIALRLTVALAGSGDGSVASSPAGIFCRPTCAASFDSGTTVQLAATPRAGSVFGGWSGCDAASGTSCTVAMNARRTVTATFGPTPPTLTVEVNAGTFGTGDTLVLSAALAPGATTSPVDAYVVLRLPDGTLLSLQPGGALVLGLVPFATGVTPTAAAGVLFSFTFTGGEPAGEYLWVGALTTPGTLDVVNGSSAPFTFTP